MDNVIKVTFPAYARLQDNKEFLGKAIEKSIFFVSVIIFPLTLFMIFAIKPLVFIIPKYTKWEPALLPFYLFAASSLFASVSTPLTNVLNATGKIKTTLKLMVLWTVLTWVLTPIFVLLWNFSGVALATLLVSTTVFLPVLLVKRIVDFAFIGNVGKPFLAATMIGIALYLIMPQLQKDLLGLVVMVTLGVIIYSVAMFVLAKEKILKSLNLLLGVLRHE
jgi:O-antigen/teichoic acid export membrane protein